MDQSGRFLNGKSRFDSVREHHFFQPNSYRIPSLKSDTAYSGLSKIAHHIEQIVLSAGGQHHFHRLFTSWAGVTPKDNAAIASATAAVPA